MHSIATDLPTDIRRPAALLLLKVFIIFSPRCIYWQSATSFVPLRVHERESKFIIYELRVLDLFLRTPKVTKK
jgi:hypothetical protein